MTSSTPAGPCGRTSGSIGSRSASRQARETVIIASGAVRVFYPHGRPVARKFGLFQLR